MNLLKRNLFFGLLGIFISSMVMAQPIAGAKPDTTRKPNSSGLKTYKDVITAKAISDGGMLWVHKLDDKYYFELPDSIFGREILVVNRMSKAAAGMRSGGFFG